MRLLTYDKASQLHITRDLADDDVPPYAILSHTWGANEEEVTFQEVRSEHCRKRAGYAKIKFCGQQAQREGLKYFWVDTCCIDKTNHVELSRAITCMYRWYQEAKICYVYLADVSTGLNNDDAAATSQAKDRTWELSFRKSRWFTRGWTLQELLAPNEVVFYSKEGRCLGTKSELKDLLHEITTIPTLALDGQLLSHFSVSERMRWTQGRKTKEKEDQAYCLLGIFNVFMPLIYGEGDNAFIRLTEAINKVPTVSFSLQAVESATFDAYGQVHQACHPATRVELLQSVRDWAQDANGKSIFWLNGAAGTGKSTISWTVAKWLADLGTSKAVALGASFFFKRGEGDRASAALLFPTIANQLATSISNFDLFLAQAIKTDPRICNKSIAEQFNKLIVEPLQRLESHANHVTYIVVVDALDECTNETDIRTILQLWAQLPAKNIVRLRLFLTSRPELVIRLGFKKMSVEAHRDLILHEVPRPIIQHDIHTFLTDALAKVREDYNDVLEDDLVDEQLADDWPGSLSLQELTNMATPLFIVAATIHRLIRDTDHPQQRLETVLKSRGKAHLSDMGAIYTMVLKAVTMESSGSLGESLVHDKFRTIIGAIISLAEPLSRNALAALLDIKPSEIQIRLRSLHAVLQVPSDGNAVIRPLHLSFGEYLTSKEVQHTPYWIDARLMHESLFRRCLQLLSSSVGLRENICRLEHPGHFLSDVPPAHIDEYLRSELRYVCRYWVYHLQSSNYRLHDNDEVHMFLQQHFIHWLEALSFMGRLADAIGFILTLKSRVADRESDQVFLLLEDAHRFVLAFRYIGEQAPLQLYASAITFAPQASIIKRVYGQLPAWIRRGPITAKTWSSELQRLEGHTAEVNTVAFSPDGSLLASASGDKTVRIWDTQTGQEVRRLEGHKGVVWAIDFSSDGSLLTSKSNDKTIRVWDTQTGQEMQRTEGVSYPSGPSATSCDGLLHASTVNNRTILVCDTKSGHEFCRFDGHTDTIQSAAFSPDGTLLATASNDKTVRTWDMLTGQESQKLKGHTSAVNVVRFSPGGSLLASASDDQTVRIWVYDIFASQETPDLEGHAKGIWAVAISHDGSLLASGSGDRTVRVWDAETGRQIQMLNHVDWVNAVAFSLDGSLVASASGDRKIRIWDIKTGEELQTFPNAGFVKKLSFSPLSTSLHTDRGTFQTNVTSTFVPPTADSIADHGLRLRNEWIEHHGKKLLWLPQEYRSSISTVSGNTIAIGRKDGIVSTIQIEYPVDPIKH